MLKSKIKIPKRKQETHKGDYGRVLVVAGSSGMLGAGVLASRAALRSGAGIVYLSVPSTLKDIANLATPEVMTKSHDELDRVKSDAVAIGPGIGRSDDVNSILHSFVISNLPLVIDADALNILSKSVDHLQKSATRIVMTPHPGEMSRLTGLTIDEVQDNRLSIAKEYSKKWNVILALKGNKTIVCDPRGKTYINNTGNPGMATAGSGDVLTGIVVSFIAQGFDLFDSAASAVHIHGLAGDLAAKEKGEYGLIASDIIDYLPKAILKVQIGKK